MVQYLDTRGFTCPVPLLKAKQALKKLPQGELLQIWLDDKSSIVDLRVLFQSLKIQVIEAMQTDEGYYFKVRYDEESAC